jgi:hypothetical protein
MPGLPQAQLKRKAEIQAQQPPEVKPVERVMIPIDVPGGTPVNEGGDSVVVPPSDEPEIKPLTLEEQWRIKSEQWESKFRSLQGVVENLEPQLRSEKELRSKIEQELQNLREAMPRPEPVPDPSEELTEEETRIYGESAPAVQKIARKVARGELTSALADLRKEIADLKAANARVETGVATNEEQRFINEVKSNVKHFDGVIKSAEWQEYLKQKVPYTKSTIGQALQTAHEARDLDSVIEIFSGFKPSRAALESMKSPILGSGGNPVDISSRSKPMLKWSDRQKVSEDFRKGRLTKDQRDHWDKLFKEAEAENRIDYAK